MAGVAMSGPIGCATERFGIDARKACEFPRWEISSRRRRAIRSGSTGEEAFFLLAEFLVSQEPGVAKVAEFD
jgi:hypothetical protein